MMTGRKINRRRVLGAAGALVGAVAGAGAVAEQVGRWGLASANVAHAAGASQTDVGGLDRKGIEAVFGITGRVQEGGVLQIDFPRHDISATVHGIKVEPDFALDSEALFKQMGSSTMMMGELALLEREVSPVMDGLMRAGIDVSAVHNHLITSPLVLFVHYMAMGNGVQLARNLRSAVAPSGTTFGNEGSNTPATMLPFNAKQVETLVGGSGETSGSVFIVSVPRREQITMSGMPVPPSLGVESLFYFQPLGSGQAALQAEMVLVATEVNAVMDTLRMNGIEVIALHNHETTENPRLFYMHAWAKGDATSLARAVRGALNHTNSALT